MRARASVVVAAMTSRRTRPVRWRCDLQVRACATLEHLLAVTCERGMVLVGRCRRERLRSVGQYDGGCPNRWWVGPKVGGTRSYLLELGRVYRLQGDKGFYVH